MKITQRTSHPINIWVDLFCMVPLIMVLIVTGIVKLAYGEFPEWAQWVCLAGVALTPIVLIFNQIFLKKFPEVEVDIGDEIIVERFAYCKGNVWHSCKSEQSIICQPITKDIDNWLSKKKETE
jgi:hypothetical protein